MKSFGSNVLVPILLFLVFPIAIANGFLLLTDYSIRPAETSAVRTQLEFPETTETQCLIANLNDSRPTLVLFYHPHCPCTVATLRMLQRMVPHLSVKPNLVLFGYCPEEKPDSWIDSSSTRIAKRISAANVIADFNAVHCRNFGVTTSGHTLLYDAQGKLVFEGGITPGRGHDSDCAASSALAHCIEANASTPIHWPVFGCPIVASEEPAQ